MNTPQLDDESNFDKFYKKVDSYICLTHDKLMKGKNLNGLLAIIIAFEGSDKGSLDFWKRIESLIEKEIT